MVCGYIDDVLVITKNEFKDHLKSLDIFIKRIMKAGLKLNAEKLLFGQTETEYLGLWVSNNGVRPLFSEVE